MKRIAYLTPLLFAYSTLFSQTKVVPFNASFERVTADSAHIARTVFQEPGFDFLRGGATDSAYLKSPLHNLPCFNSKTAEPLLAELRRKKSSPY